MPAPSGPSTAKNRPANNASYRGDGSSGSISRVLSPHRSGADGHLSWASVTRNLMRPTREQVGRPCVPLFGLAPDGVCPASQSPDCRWALTPPFHPYSPEDERYVSVALSVELPRLGVTQRPARWSSDFPPAGHQDKRATVRSTGTHPKSTNPLTDSQRPRSRAWLARRSACAFSLRGTCFIEKLLKPARRSTAFRCSGTRPAFLTR